MEKQELCPLCCGQAKFQVGNAFNRFDCEVCGEFGMTHQQGSSGSPPGGWRLRGDFCRASVHNHIALMEKEIRIVVADDAPGKQV
jgi:hypothetical protein